MRISDWSSDVCSSDLVDVKPERRTFPINRGEDFANGLFDTGLPDAPNRKASYPRCLDVAIGVVRIKFIALANLREDRTSVVSGTSVSVRVDLGGRRIITKKNTLNLDQLEVSHKTNYMTKYTATNTHANNI